MLARHLPGTLTDLGGPASLKIREFDSKTNKRNCAYIKGKSDVATRYSRHWRRPHRHGLELVGAWPEHLRDDVRSLPQRGELVAVLAALDEAEDQVSDVEGPTPHSTAVVPS